MILVDTSVWVEFFKGHTPYLEVLGKFVEERSVISIEAIFGELLQGARNHHEQSVIEAYWQQLPKINEIGIWLQAGSLSSKEKMFSKGVGLIDLAMVVAAKNEKAHVWTLDKKLLGILSESNIFILS